MAGKDVLLLIVCLWWALQPGGVHAQAPSTDIYLCEIIQSGPRLQIAAPHNLTNRAGYDNQPCFLPGGHGLLYTSQRNGQTDIFLYDVPQQRVRQLTRTPESEYSPTPMPDGRAFSVVRVEKDTALVQRLWRFPFANGSPEVIFPDINPVGYHAWANANVAGLFVLGNPPVLQIADRRGGAPKTVAEHVGRSLHKVPGEESISFVHKTAPETWWIKTYRLSDQKITRLTKTLPGREDYTWLAGGSLLMGSGAKLYRWRPAFPSEWQLVADLHDAGLREISRLAVSRDERWLAVVAAH